MWERGLAAEHSVRLCRTATWINWTITLERVFVWLRLAEAQGPDVTEVDHAHQAWLGRARLNLYLLQGNRKTSAWRLRRAHHNVIRQAMQAAEHIGLAHFPDATSERQAIQMYMATIYGFVDATAPEAVAHLDAWRSTPAANGPVGVPNEASHDGTDAVLTPAVTIPLTEFVPRPVNGHAVATDPDRLAAGNRINGGTDTPGRTRGRRRS